MTSLSDRKLVLKLHTSGLKINDLYSLAGSAGALPTGLPLSQSWESAVGSRDGTEKGGRGVGRGRGGGGGGPLPENWELAFSDSGEPYYIE